MGHLLEEKFQSVITAYELTVIHRLNISYANVSCHSSTRIPPPASGLEQSTVWNEDYFYSLISNNYYSMLQMQKLFLKTLN